MMDRACDQCHGTDTQRECERGQCYAQQYLEDQRQREQAEWDEMQWRRRIEEEGRP